MKSSEKSQGGISLARIAKLRTAEANVFRRARPKSEAAAGKGIAGFFGGVPMHWMNDWPTPFPIVVDRRQGRDDHRHRRQPARRFLPRRHRLDVRPFAAAGRPRHPPSGRPRPDLHAARARMRWCVGRLLSERFGLPEWQIATTATDANRFALRVARAVTGRAEDPRLQRLLSWLGRRDDGAADGRQAGQPAGPGRRIPRPDRGTRRSSSSTTCQRSKKALAAKDVACVITEPVLTNCCMVLPEPGFHDALRELTRETGTLLLIDETHTISTGPGGYTQTHGLEPDLFVLGKPIAGGVPASVWGMSAEVAERYARLQRDQGARLFRHGHDAVGQSAAVRRHARDARRGDDRDELRPYGAAGARGSTPGSTARHRTTSACPGMSPASARASSSSARRAR